MKKIIIVFILLLITAISFAETHIPPGNVSGIWTFPNSPYIIDGEINIPVDNTLIIEPGVQVLFSGHYKFYIFGRLLAEGTATDTITFTAQDTTVGWYGLEIFNTNSSGQDSSKVVYCKLKYVNISGICGAIYFFNSSSHLIKNCLITQNITRGIYCHDNSSPSIKNVNITGNTGGLYCINNSNPNLEDVTIIGNIGTGITCFDSSPILENVIIQKNKAIGGGGIYCNNANLSLSNVTITGNFATNSGGGICCTGNSSVNFDPDNRCNIFLNYAGLGNDLYAFDCPPINVIVDTFTILEPDQNFACPIDNFTFDILNGKVVQVDNDLYVSPDGSDDNSGLSPDNPLLTISWALIKIYADSINPHTIHLTNGIYSPSQTGERFSLNCRSYVSLHGEDTFFTILDGEETGGILTCYIDNCFSIENMTIKNGRTKDGGGVFCYDHSSPDITNVIIVGNSASIFEYSTGGGIYCGKYSSPQLTNVIISGNTAYYVGGGIICYDNSSPNLVNVTICENTAYFGGGIYCWHNSSPTLVNCILWNDSPNEIGGSVTATYSDIQGGWAGTGNIDADPLFADPRNGDFHLTWTNFPIQDSTMSPCIDAGDPSSPLDPDSTRADMGAYYFDQSQQGVGDTPIQATTYLLYQNYPNPFNTSTIISFNLATKSHKKARIKIYNIKGQLVKILECGESLSTKAIPIKSGLYSISWDGKDENGNPLSSGIYFYKLVLSDKIIDTKKCLLLK